MLARRPGIEILHILGETEVLYRDTESEFDESDGYSKFKVTSDIQALPDPSKLKNNQILSVKVH